MTKQLGPTFGDEVIAAGLGGKPFAWGDTDDSITGRENLSPADNATLDGVVAAHDPSKKHKNIIPTTDWVARLPIRNGWRWKNRRRRILRRTRSAIAKISPSP